MRATTTSTRHLAPDADGRQAQRLVGFERHYRCSAGHESRSWARLRACPGCGERLAVAIIHRAALAEAC